MSAETCQGCKRLTSNVASDYLDNPDHIVTKCFMAWEKNKAVRGCAFNGLSEGAQMLWQEFIDKTNREYEQANKDKKEKN